MCVNVVSPYAPAPSATDNDQWALPVATTTQTSRLRNFCSTITCSGHYAFTHYHIIQRTTISQCSCAVLFLHMTQFFDHVYCRSPSPAATSTSSPAHSASPVLPTLWMDVADIMKCFRWGETLLLVCVVTAGTVYRRVVVYTQLDKWSHTATNADLTVSNTVTLTHSLIHSLTHTHTHSHSLTQALTSQSHSHLITISEYHSHTNMATSLTHSLAGVQGEHWLSVSLTTKGWSGKDCTCYCNPLPSYTRGAVSQYS